ncbi:hypothetical protein [Halorhabdus amylolytica]|uniref:hypothetical protein n=1 Tax=Halorhabdus amylolytica TaxID=2559573 RepID=UPI0010AA6BF8|nr:hypothetical protein [Halorhabdus amylolytica]
MTREIVTDGVHIPDPVKQWDYWVLWDFQVKQPRAPWKAGHCYKTEWKQDGDVDPRTDYSQAKAAADLGASLLHEHYGFPDDPPEKVGPTLLLPHEGPDTPGPDVADPSLLFIDYDDVIVDGEIPGEVWDVAAEIGGPLFVSRSYFDSDKDKAGLHQLARGTLPGSVTTVNAEFGTRGHIEIYYRSRMTGFTWEHVRGTPTDELPEATDAVASVVDTYANPTTKRRASIDPDEQAERTPLEDLTPPEELADMNTTDDMDDVFSAIKHVTASDIRLRSGLTEELGVRKSYNPSWEHSDSGTRLGYDRINGNETWIYRAANQPVDALQVVAREEGITRDVTRYPSGGAFWKAVEALRSRGATIPYYEGNNGTHPDYLRLFEDTDDEEDQRRKALRAMRASNRQ